MQPLEVSDHFPGMRITVRLGFSGRGVPLGPPRFTYITPNAPARIKTEYENAISEALKRCTPLSFSRELAATIAGVPVILRYEENGLIQAQLQDSLAYVSPAPLPSSQIQPATPVPLLQAPLSQELPIWRSCVANPIPNLSREPERRYHQVTRAYRPVRHQDVSHGAAGKK